ncbi:MAG TPA: hypothetical protein VJN71_07120 [Nitrososphaerales archaeon]|nr:hypothetical protein [Nitrososphaerales archaeon]
MNGRNLGSKLIHTNRGRIALFLFAALLVVSATASVYVFFYQNTTATVQTSDLKLYAGSDSTATCTAYPCAHVAISSTGDVATVSMSMFAAGTAFSPVPASYYSNVTAIKNTGTTSHSIKSVQITNVADPSSNLGQIMVYYCTTQTEFNSSGSLVTPANCVGSFSIVSTTGGSVAGTYPVSIAAGAVQYIEIVAYAKSTATTGSVTFNIAIQWA